MYAASCERNQQLQPYSFLLDNGLKNSLFQRAQLKLNEVSSNLLSICSTKSVQAALQPLYWNELLFDSNKECVIVQHNEHGTTPIIGTILKGTKSIPNQYPSPQILKWTEPPSETYKWIFILCEQWKKHLHVLRSSAGTLAFLKFPFSHESQPRYMLTHKPSVANTLFPSKSSSPIVLMNAQTLMAWMVVSNTS